MSNILEVKEQYINTVIIHNPIDPYSSRKVAKLIWDNDKTLYDYIYDLPENYEWIVVYNGEEVTIEQSKKIKPMPDTMLVISPKVTGGSNSGGKQTLRMIVTAAIIVVGTIYLGPWGTGALGWGGAFTTSAAVASVYSTASSMIWNRPDIDNSADDFEDTYGADGAKATAKEGIPVGLVYGKYRVAGNVIQNRTENVGDTQDLYLLQLLSEGEVESIDNILINEQPLTQFNNVETEVRLGTDNQELIPWFDDTFVSEYKGTDITTEWSYMRTKNQMEKFSIDLIFPYGLNYQGQKDNGKTRKGGLNVDFEVQYKSIDGTDNDWRNINSVLKCYIRNVLHIDDGDKYIFTDEDGLQRVYAFHNVLYKDFDIVKEDDKVTQVIIYIQRSTNLEQTIKNFIEALKRDVLEDEIYIQAPQFKGTYDKYSSGLFNINLEPEGFLHDYARWDIEVVGQNAGTAESLASQDNKIISIWAYSKQPVRRTISSPQLPLDYYDVRIRRTFAERPQEEDTGGSWMFFYYDKVQWLNLNEIILDDICYNHSAIMAVKVRLDGQLSSMPNITADVKGIKVNHYDYDGNITENKWSDNPAWIALDVLTNKRYGGGLDVSRIDIPKFIEWKEYCEENEITFNAYIGSESNLWDVLKSILMVGHAQLVVCGTKISLSIDKIRDEVYLFNNSNIIKDSFSTSWAGLQDRANTFEFTYYDANDNYNQKTIKIVDSESMTSQKELKELKITAIGITNEKQATRECKRLILKNKYLQQQVTFSAPVEAVGCSIGDVVVVQHDVPQWGYGGKLKKGSTVNTLFLDRTITMTDNQEYMVLVHHSAVCRAVTEAQTVVSNSIFIAGSFTEKAKRLKCNGKDYEIIKIIPGSSLTEIKVNHNGQITSGSEIELWDTDVLEEGQVITDAYRDIDVIELQKPLRYEPQPYSSWLFGYKDRYQKKFAITAMSGLNTDTITLTGIEYSEASYDYDNYQGDDPIISDIAKKIEPVYNLTASEELVKIGSAFSTNVTINWEVSALPTYFGADIYTRPDANSPFMKVAEVTNGLHSYTITNMDDGDYIEVKVVGFDGAGRRASFEESPIIGYEVVGKNKKPATPTNFTAKKTTQGIMLSWNPVVEADLSGYIIKLGSEWVNAETIDANVATNRYTVQYTEAGLKKFLLKSVDVFGNESEREAVAEIQLEPPLDPIDFMSIQNNDFIVLKWNNLDETVEKFRIKEGESWGSGTIVADVSGYSTTVPINGYYNRKFWIKSIDRFGVFCKNPVFTSPMANEHQSKNVIVEYDESGNGFPNPKINMDLINDDLIVRESAKYGEYSWYVDIGEKLYSRIISEDMIDAIQYSPRWMDFPNPWNSYEAQSPWVVLGSMDSVQIERQMALPKSLPDNIIEAFSFYNTPDGEVLNTKPLDERPYEYGDGRFRKGIIVDDKRSLEYNINIPEVFSLQFWIRPQLLQSAGYLELINENEGHFMRIRYYSSDKSYSLEDDKENKITIKSDFAVDEPILMCINQSETTRTLMIGFSKDLKVLSQSKELQPIGPITYMAFR